MKKCLTAPTLLSIVALVEHPPDRRKQLCGENCIIKQLETVSQATCRGGQTEVVLSDLNLVIFHTCLKPPVQQKSVLSQDFEKGNR